MSFLHKMHTVAHAVGEYVTPVLKESAFAQRGVLTPEEFVIAGDQLIRTCPTWQWASGDPSNVRNYLPKDKQFLTTRGVPCEHRVKALEANYSAEMEVEGVEDGNGEDGWLATHNNAQNSTDDDNGDEEEETLDIDSMKIGIENVTLKTENTVEKETEEEPKQAVVENEDGFIDLNDFVEPALEDEDGSTKKEVEENDGIVKMRTYDLSITYDKYYQTPRVWLYGYDEQQNPLKGNEILEDIMQDYANKTVTIEPHPHLNEGVSFASIHPCRHASVMKKIVDQLSEGGKTAEPSQYLFIFLKFIQSVIPTINYDNTIEVQASM